MKRRYSLPLLLLVFVILAGGIVATGGLLYRSQQDHCRYEESEELVAIADLKVSELTMWRNERLADARVFCENKAFSALVRRSSERPQDSTPQEELRSWIGCVQASYHYDQVSLLDAACNEWMSVPNTKTPHSTLTIQKTREALATGQATFADFYPDEFTKKVYFRLFVPILDGPSGGRMLGVLRLRMDPAAYLYPFLQRWPVPSETAETLLIRKEGNDAVFLNELRFQKDTALSLRVSLDRTDLPSVKAILGQEGIVEGIDYRGVPVLAVVRAMPDSPWFLVAKMDLAEVYAPMRERLWLTVLFVGVLLFALTAVVGFLWRQQHAALYRQKFEAENKYRKLFESSRDALMTLAPPSWKFALCNQATVEMFRLKNAREFAAHRPWELSPERQMDGRDSVEKAQEMIETAMRDGSISFEWTHKRFDGEEFPAIVMLTRTEQAGTVLIQATVRDITEQKERERRQALSVEVLEILNDSPTLLDAINHAITAIQRTTGFDAVGIRLREGDDFPCFSQSGFSGNFLQTENTLIVRDQDGGPCRDNDGNICLACTCGLVLSGKTDSAHPLFTQGGSFWTNNSLPLLDLPAEDDPRLHPRNRCIHEGFCSFALIPIRDGQEIVGLLQLNNRKKASFTPETICFFEGLGTSFGAALIRKRVEQKLLESEARMRAITDSAQDAILMMDPRGLISYWNPAAESILGYQSEEAMGKNLHNLLMPERYLDSHRAAFPAFGRTGQGNAVGKTTELEAKRKDGREISVALSLSAVSLNGAWHAVGILRDITEQKRAKEQIEQYAAMLESNNQALEESNQIAESATRAKSEFLANMSHEIRTPMTAILGYADLLLDEEGIEKAPPHRREAFETIHRNGKHLLGLINDILDLSKVEAGKMQIEPIRCSPCELLADVVSLMRVRADAKHLKLDIDMAGPLPETIFTDPLRLRQVLVNLVGNAVKFTDQGEVRITARLTDASGSPRLRFDITDTGIGMNEEQIGKLFQAFSQVDNSSMRKFGGTGLGLCISKRLTEAMGGKIEVHSAPSKGSTFSVTIDPGSLDGIPMIRNSQEALLVRPPTPTVAIPDEIILSGRILLAEDGPDNQRFIAFVLKKAGAKVTLAENGQIAYDEAMAAVAQGTPFDVILMDMQMPVLDGYEATRQLREQGYSGSIIALTAHAMAEDRKKCIHAGCDDYATKPIDRQVLLTTVAHWMAPGRTTELPKPVAAPAASESNMISTMPSAFIYSQMAADPDLGELVDLFVQEMPDRINALETHARSRDWQQLTRTAHQIKGAAGSYGFSEITPSAARLEAAARNGSQEEEILSTLDELLSLCRQVRSGVPQGDETVLIAASSLLASDSVNATETNDQSMFAGLE